MSANNGDEQKGDNKIRWTRNYRLFHLEDGANRDLDVKKHKPLMESMKEYGFLREFPVCVRRDGPTRLVVKDGQHRLAIAETLGLPVAYAFQSCNWNTAKVNSTSVRWQLIDYARNHIANGKMVYQHGLDFQKQHGLPIGTAFALLAGTTSFGNVEDQFKDGGFKIKDREWADAVASVYSQMMALAPEALRSTRFIEACMAVCRVKDFDGRRLVEQADRKCRDKLVPYSTKDAYLQMIEDVYNFGRKQTIPLKFAAVNAMKDRNASTKAKTDKKAKQKQPKLEAATA